jgi:hypothetical protein
MSDATAIFINFSLLTISNTVGIQNFLFLLDLYQFSKNIDSSNYTVQTIVGQVYVVVFCTILEILLVVLAQIDLQFDPKYDWAKVQDANNPGC